MPSSSSPTFTPPAPKFTLPEPSKDAEMPVLKLNSGHTMPVVGYGTFRPSPGVVGPAVLEAIKAGYRHFDFAHVYGNEAEIGAALSEAFETGLVKREDLFCTGKLWNSDHEVDIVPQACEYSLKDLGIGYFDLYLIHFPVAWKHKSVAEPHWGQSELGDTPLIDTWRAMEALVDAGKVRSIGVSNYPLLTLHDLVTQARIMPAVNQIEVHAYYSRDSLVNYCISRNICVTAHTPLGGGASNKEDFGIRDVLLEHPAVLEIATKHGVSAGQVLLRWLLQRGVTVIPKSTQPGRIKTNLDLFSFALTAEDMEALAGLDKYQSYKTNPNPLSGFIGGADWFSEEGTDIFD